MNEAIILCKRIDWCRKAKRHLDFNRADPATTYASKLSVESLLTYFLVYMQHQMKDCMP